MSSTALLARIATLKDRVAKLEKTWGIKKAAGDIGASFDSPGVYADNERPLAVLLATVVANGNEAAKNKILQSDTFRAAVRAAVKQGDGKDAHRENAGIVLAVLQEALAEAQKDETGPEGKATPIQGNGEIDRAAYEASLHKAAQLESFKGTLAKTAMAGHETNFFAQRERRKHARELIHRTRQIAATL